MKRLNYAFTFIMVVLLTLLFMSKIVSAESEFTGKYMTLRDNRGRVIARTDHQIVIGDEYLNSQNQLYQVTKVQGNTAIVKLVKTEKLTASLLSQLQDFWAGLIKLDFLRGEIKPNGPIGIYHTHSDESFISGDGMASKFAHGGIFQVGDALASAFERYGIPVIHSKTPHDPHDAMAYDRSRRTAVQLLKDRSFALLDVHRDAVPAGDYNDIIRNKRVTKVQLVVGRQNPNFQANNDFAKRIKASCDRLYPGFIKGIFYGKGKYNQDLGARCILLEIGSDTNNKIAAERGAQIFAAAAKDVIYGNSDTGFINRGSLRSIFLIVVAVIGGAGLFLLINRRGIKDSGKEFTGAIGEDNPAEKSNSQEKANPENNGKSS